MNKIATWASGMVMAVGLVGGCATGRGYQRAAADALDVLAGQLEQALIEYHRDLTHTDDLRQRQAQEVLADRLGRGAGSGAAADHAAAFAEALERIRADRDAAASRLHASRENTAAIREISDGLRRSAPSWPFFSDWAAQPTVSSRTPPSFDLPVRSASTGIQDRSIR